MSYVNMQNKYSRVYTNGIFSVIREQEDICFESGNLISLISTKSSHLEGMALTLQ